MISVIIPTYKEPNALDLCLKSTIKGQVYNNEIIVVIDGFYDINKEVLEKYKGKINILNLEENVGMVRAQNLGVYNASNELFLMVNDDNVFPDKWDEKLLNHYKSGMVLTPNQIEPRPSIFNHFVIQNFGETPELFDYDLFIQEEKRISYDRLVNHGSTFPFMMNKIDYLRLGGWDETYPGPWVVDWEFFMKCQMAGLKMMRSYNAHFYHFGSISTASPEKQTIEMNCHQYFYYKWGAYIKHDFLTNLKYI